MTKYISPLVCQAALEHRGKCLAGRKECLESLEQGEGQSSDKELPVVVEELPPNNGDDDSDHANIELPLCIGHHVEPLPRIISFNSRSQAAVTITLMLQTSGLPSPFATVITIPPFWSVCFHGNPQLVRSLLNQPEPLSYMKLDYITILLKFFNYFCH